MEWCGSGIGRCVLAVVSTGWPGSAVAQVRVDLPAADRTLTVEVEPVFRLGGLRAEGWESFERIRDVGFDALGRLHLLDQGAGAVRIVGVDGALVRTLGRRGEGPGEFSAPTGMAVAPDGVVLVEDLGRRSLAVFGPDGGYLRNAEPDARRGRIGTFAVDARGRIVGLPPLVYTGRTGAAELTLSIPTEGGVIENPPGLPLLRADLDGGRAEVVRWNWVPRREAEGGRPGEVAFLPRVRWALLPDGRVAVVDSLDYRIHLVGGSEETVLLRPLPVRAPTEADRRAEIERRLAEAGAPGGAAAGLGRDRDEADAAARRERRAALDRSLAFHPELQIVQGLRADPAGRIWVERVGDDATRPGPVDVVSSGGRYLGTLPEGSFTLPDAFGPDGLAVWIERDELDVPAIVVRRVSPSPGR